MTQFADLTEAEFKAKYLGYRGSGFQSCNATNSTLNVKDIPANVDWRTVNGTLTPVKIQGGCGSCWAFSTTESLESESAIHGFGL
jgi:C1A family cysteine protease